jgi:transposase InsO family protein
VKGTLAELQVSQDELRRDRDEWRWRAERLLADLQRGVWRRWCRRADEVLNAVTSWFRGVLADVQNRLSDVKANRGEKS